MSELAAEGRRLGQDHDHSGPGEGGGDLHLPDGSASDPSVSFDNDRNMGIYRSGSNQLSISTGGSEAVQVDNNQNVTMRADLTVEGTTTNTVDILTTDVEVQDGGGTTQIHIDGDAATPFIELPDQGVVQDPSGNAHITVNDGGSTDLSRSLVLTGGSIDLEGTGNDTTVTLDNTFNLTIEDNGNNDILTINENNARLLLNDNRIDDVTGLRGTGSSTLNITSSTGTTGAVEENIALQTVDSNVGSFVTVVEAVASGGTPYFEIGSARGNVAGRGLVRLPHGEAIEANTSGGNFNIRALAVGVGTNDNIEIGSDGNYNQVQIGTSGGGAVGVNNRLDVSNGNLRINADGNKVEWGAGQDAAIAYEATPDVLDVTGKRVRIGTGEITLQDAATDPSSNGQLFRNGSDVKVYSGGAVRNLTNVGTAPLSDSGSDTAQSSDIYTLPNDQDAIGWGNGPDYWSYYDSGDTQWQLVSTDIDGGGTDGVLMAVDDGTQTVDFPGSINTGTIDIADDSGDVRIINMGVTSSPAAGTEESIAIGIDQTDQIVAYSEADGSGGLQNERVEVKQGNLRIDGSNAIEDASGNAHITINDGGDTTVNQTLQLQGHVNLEDTNRRSLSGNISLSATDAQIQSIDPNGSNRTVTLPAESNGLEFIISNRADASETITVEDDSNSTLITLNQDDVGRFISDGTGWTSWASPGAVT